MASSFIVVKFFVKEEAIVQPLFLRVNRRSLFSAVLAALFEHFADQNLKTRIDDLDQLWLSHEGTPLRWETPVGVIFDRFLAAAAVQHNSDSVALPFAVAVHGNGKPDDIGSCEDARLHAHYMNTLKQASFLRFGSAQPIMEMSKELQRDLWDSLKKQDLPRAEECLASTGFGSSKMKYVPVRLFVGSHAEPIQFRVERRFKSDSGDEGGSAPMVTLGDLLKTWVPDYPLLKGRPYRGVDNTFAVVGGIFAPFETPLGVLYDELKYCDMYMYIALGEPVDEEEALMEVEASQATAEGVGEATTENVAAADPGAV